MESYGIRIADRGNGEQTWGIDDVLEMSLGPGQVREVGGADPAQDYSTVYQVTADGRHTTRAVLAYSANERRWDLKSSNPGLWELAVDGPSVTAGCLL